MAVEELREALIREIGFYSVDHDKGGTDNLFNAIDAFASGWRSEGVAEGTEQERERIRAISPLIDKGSDNYHTPFYLVDVDVLAPKGVVHTRILYPPASVLAPTKESEK